MSNALTQDAGPFIAGLGIDVTAAAGAAAPATASASNASEAPVGYRWVSKRWRVLPDGTRDYAAFYGKTAFNVLLPVSSRLHSPKR